MDDNDRLSNLDELSSDTETDAADMDGEGLGDTDERRLCLVIYVIDIISDIFHHRFRAGNGSYMIFKTRFRIEKYAMCKKWAEVLDYSPILFSICGEKYGYYTHRICRQPRQGTP